MNLGRIININIFHKIRQLETLVKPGSLLIRNCNAAQFPRFTSSLANLNHYAIPNMNNYTKRILFKLPAQSTISMTQIRTVSDHTDHVRYWVIERLLAISLLTLIPTAFILDNKFVDIVLAVGIIIHAHWGLEAIILDYARPIVVGIIFSKVAFFALYLLSASTLAGLLVLIYNGPGLSKIIKQGWAIDKEKLNDN